MQSDWELILDLYGGTRRMRERGERWLPRWDGEESIQWQGRRDRSFLYNALKNTVRRVTTKPFSRPVTINGELSELLDGIESDVDGIGTNLTQFAREVYESAGKFGLCHIFVDFPVIRPTDAEGNPRPATLADEQSVNARPRFIKVEAPQLLGWQWEVRSGVKVLTQVRFIEQRVEPLGQYADQVVEYIRIITETTYETWRKSLDDKDFIQVMEQSGTHTFGHIPMVTYYMNRTGFMTAEPTFIDIAWLNIEHWQSSSDQRHILSMARFAILFGRGFSEDQIKRGITIGPARFIGTEDDKGDLKFVEIQGTAIQAGRDDLQDLQYKMEAMGVQPLISRTRDTTATGKRIDESRTSTDVQAWVEAENNALEECYQLAAEWTKTKLPDDFSVEVFADFGINSEDVHVLTFLLGAVEKRKISHLTFLRECKRRGVLSDIVVPEDEIEIIDEEGPDLGLVPPMSLDAPSDGENNDTNPDGSGNNPFE